MCCVVKEQNINGQRIHLTLSSCDQESQLSVVFFSWNEHCGCPLRWAAQVLKGVINLNISNWSSKGRPFLMGPQSILMVFHTLEGVKDGNRGRAASSEYSAN